MARFTLVAAIILLTEHTATGYLVSPPGIAFPGASTSCSKWVADIGGLTCADIEATYGITEAQFLEWNPDLSLIFTDCDILAGYDYCVGIDFETFTTSSASSSTSSALVTSTIASSTATLAHSTTLSGNGVSTPSPVQTGMVSTCDEFYQVASGDTCAGIASEYGISLTDFYSWNPAVGSSYAYLDVDDYVCVGIVGSSSTTATATSTATTTSTITTGNGVTTPTPIQTGTVTDCNAFYYVVSGDSCGSIASDKKVTVAHIEEWNPAIGTDCTDLWLDTYICVGIL